MNWNHIVTETLNTWFRFGLIMFAYHFAKYAMDREISENDKPKKRSVILNIVYVVFNCAGVGVLFWGLGGKNEAFIMFGIVVIPALFGLSAVYKKNKKLLYEKEVARKEKEQKLYGGYSIDQIDRMTEREFEKLPLDIQSKYSYYKKWEED